MEIEAPKEFIEFSTNIKSNEKEFKISLYRDAFLFYGIYAFWN